MFRESGIGRHRLPAQGGGEARAGGTLDDDVDGVEHGGVHGVEQIPADLGIPIDSENELSEAASTEAARPR
jgi:hypothetical protein